MLDFSAFDTSKIDEYAKQVKATWGQTEAYKEYEKKSKDRTPAEENLQKILIRPQEKARRNSLTERFRFSVNSGKMLYRKEYFD